MAHCLSKHCFCFLKEVILQCSTYFSALILPLQEARLQTLLGPADHQNVTDVEFENIWSKTFLIIISLDFLQALIILL